jgi:hypothetical protein
VDDVTAIVTTKSPKTALGHSLGMGLLRLRLRLTWYLKMPGKEMQKDTHILHLLMRCVGNPARNSSHQGFRVIGFVVLLSF